MSKFPIPSLEFAEYVQKKQVAMLESIEAELGATHEEVLSNIGVTMIIKILESKESTRTIGLVAGRGDMVLKNVISAIQQLVEGQSESGQKNDPVALAQVLATITRYILGERVQDCDREGRELPVDTKTGKREQPLDVAAMLEKIKSLTPEDLKLPDPPASC